MTVLATQLTVLCGMISIVGVSLVGYGRLLLALQSTGAARAWSGVTLGDTGLLGLVSITAVGQLLHFVVPLSPTVVLSVHAGGLAAFWLARTRVRLPVTRPEAVFAVAAAGTLLLQALNDRPALDAGVYHVTAIKWVAEFPVIPGLGNLHGRLAFNSSLEILAAMLELPRASWRGAFLSNALLGFFVLLALFQRVRRAMWSEDAVSLSTSYGLVLLGGFCAHSFYFRSAVGSLASDFATAILAVYAIYLLLQGLEARDTWPLAWTVVLAAFAVTVKLSALALLVGGTAIAGYAGRRTAASGPRPLLLAGLLGATLLVPWTARGLLLSGCVAYPEPWSCVPALPWTVPRALAVNESRFVLDWARGSNVPPDGLGTWLGSIWRSAGSTRKGMLVTAMVIGGFALTVSELLTKEGRGSPPASPWRPLLLVGAVPTLGIILALVKAPALRFAMGYLYGLGALLLALGGLARIRRIAIERWRRWTPVTLCVLLAAQSAASGWGYVRHGRARPWPDLPSPVTWEKTTRSGLKVFVSWGETCWDAPLPCTPFFDPTLRRVPFLGRFYLTGSNVEVYCCVFGKRYQLPGPWEAAQGLRTEWTVRTHAARPQGGGLQR